MLNKLLAICILCLSFSINAKCNTPTFSNSNDTVALSDFDKIIRIDSTEIIVRINRFSNSDIFYVYPLNKEELSIPRKTVHKIIYSTGKIETLNPLFKEIDVEEETIPWEQVEILDDVSQTDTLIEISDFDALFESTKMKISTTQLEKNALIILKKKAANAGGKYLLITNKIIHKAYGDLPSIEMYGKAYRKK